MNKASLLITQAANGYMVSTPSPNRWSDHGQDVCVFESFDGLMAHVTERLRPPEADAESGDGQ